MRRSLSAASHMRQAMALALRPLPGPGRLDALEDAAV